MSEFLSSLPQFISQRSPPNEIVTRNPGYRSDVYNQTLSSFHTEYQKMDISSFDPDSFLDATIDQVSTSRPLLPATRDFIATIGAPKSRKWSSNKDPSNPKAGIAVDIPLEFTVAQLPPDVQALYTDAEGKISIEKIVIVDGLMLDLTDAGLIDLTPGKNPRTRKYRDATDLNRPGENFSFRMLTGRQVRVKIRHEVYQGNTYDKADAIAKI